MSRKVKFTTFVSRKAKFTTFLSQFVAKRKKRIGRKFLVRIYATRKSHRLCQPESVWLWLFFALFCKNRTPSKSSFIKSPNFDRILKVWANATVVLEESSTKSANIKCLDVSSKATVLLKKVRNDECKCLKSANLKWGILLPSDHIYGKNWPSTSIKEFVLRAFTSAASLLIILISSFNAGLKLKATENIRDTEQRAWLMVKKDRKI